MQTVDQITATVEVSIIIPVYNSKLYIRETVESLDRQNLLNYELILIDDGSSDGSAEILNALSVSKPRVSVIKNKKNEGVCRSRNVGIEAAKGKYIVFVDADDVFSENAINGLVHAMDKTRAVLGYLKVIRIDPKGFLMHELTKDGESNLMLIDDPMIPLMKTNIVGCGSGFIIRNDKELYFDVNMRAKANEICGDWEFFINAATKGTFVKINDSFVGYRIHNNSMSRSTYEPLESLKYIIEKYTNTYSARGLSFRRNSRRIIGLRLAVLVSKGRFIYILSNLNYLGSSAILSAIGAVTRILLTKAVYFSSNPKNLFNANIKQIHYKDLDQS